MNPWQAARQIRWLLAAATWPDAGGQLVFSQVAVMGAAFRGLCAEFR